MSEFLDNEEWSTISDVEREYFFNDKLVEGNFIVCDNEDFTLLIDKNQDVIVNLFIGSQKEVTVPDDAAVIADDLFEDCENLETLNLPKSIKAVGKNAFAAPNLKRINYAGTLEQWCKIKFCSAPFASGCELYIGEKKVTAVSVEKIGTIPRYAFAGLKGLSFIKIGDGVKTVENNAFEYCEDLGKVILSADVEVLGSSAFEGSNPKDGFEIDANNPKYKTIGNCIVDKTENSIIAGCDKSVVENGIEKIGDYAFTDCTFEEIELPPSVKEIGDGAFSGTHLKKIVLSEGVKKLGNNVFEYCAELTSAIIPATVKSIGKAVFCGCQSLTSIRAERGNKVYSAEGNCVLETASGKCIAGCKDSEIPDYATEIGAMAFYDCKELRSLRLPRGLRKIGICAFTHIGAEELVFPATLSEIELSAFEGCKSLKRITFEGETALDSGDVFYGCAVLESVTAPKQYKKHYKKIFGGFKNGEGKKLKLEFVK